MGVIKQIKKKERKKEDKGIKEGRYNCTYKPGASPSQHHIIPK